MCILRQAVLLAKCFRQCLKHGEHVKYGSAYLTLSNTRVCASPTADMCLAFPLLWHPTLKQDFLYEFNSAFLDKRTRTNRSNRDLNANADFSVLGVYESWHSTLGTEAMTRLLCPTNEVGPDGKPRTMFHYGKGVHELVRGLRNLVIHVFYLHAAQLTLGCSSHIIQTLFRVPIGSMKYTELTEVKAGRLSSRNSLDLSSIYSAILSNISTVCG
jgi:hypothetical protein